MRSISTGRRLQRRLYAGVCVIAITLVLALAGCGGSDSDPSPNTSGSATPSDSGGTPTPSESTLPLPLPKGEVPARSKALEDPVLEHTYRVSSLRFDVGEEVKQVDKRRWLAVKLEVESGKPTMNQPQCSSVQVSPEAEYKGEASQNVTMSKADILKEAGLKPFSPAAPGKSSQGWCLYSVTGLNDLPTEAKSNGSASTQPTGDVASAHLWLHAHRMELKDPNGNSFPDFNESSEVAVDSEPKPSAETEQNDDGKQSSSTGASASGTQ